jgi:hypothetical protein
MNNDRLEALLWARLDGTIEPEEMAELEAHLSADPGPREFERRIVAIAEGLDNLEHERPPAALRENIQNALANATPPTQHHENMGTIPPTHPTASWHTKWLPVAASLLIGVAIGYLLHPNSGRTIDHSIAAGTMVIPADDPESRVEVHLDGGAGQVIAHRDMVDIMIDVELTHETDVAVTLEGAGGPVHLEGLSSTDASATEVSTHHGWVVVSAIGPCSVRFSAVASTANDPLRLRVASGGFTIEEHWIGPPREALEP